MKKLSVCCFVILLTLNVNAQSTLTIEKIGWLPDNRNIYFQSEETGFSHLYTLDVTTGGKKALTSGNFEVYEPRLSNDGKTWYFISNEVGHGKTGSLLYTRSNRMDSWNPAVGRMNIRECLSYLRRNSNKISDWLLRARLRLGCGFSISDLFATKTARLQFTPRLNLLFQSSW